MAAPEFQRRPLLRIVGICGLIGLYTRTFEYDGNHPGAGVTHQRMSFLRRESGQFESAMAERHQYGFAALVRGSALVFFSDEARSAGAAA